MRVSPKAARLIRITGEILLSLVGAAIIALLVPWQHIFSTTIPGGGDNPAHPVLMMSIGEALFEHLKLIHYSYAFWGGYEAFQFYFPLAYASGAALAKVIDPNIAFKVTTVFPILALPTAFYWMAASVRLSVFARFIASLLAIPFLFTEAHVMWGGNVFSALAGMIGNQWGFVFFVIAFGQLIRAYETGRFSFTALIFSVLAALSHFYTFLMLIVLFGIFLIQDLGRASWHRTRPRLGWGTYAIGICTGLLITWWALPLIYYKSMSVDLAGDWDIKLLTTFTLAERICFGASLLISMLYLVRERSRAVTSVLLFLLLYLTLYSVNDIFNTTAFLKNRLWPSIYFSLYFAVILAVEIIYRIAPRPLSAAVAAGLIFLIPSETPFNNSKGWMEWNYIGLQSKPAWRDMEAVFKILKSAPRGRVSYESADEANGSMGSVRTPELIPYLTGQELILGGIVNSASYAGIGYFLHCLDSETCAGWPAGSVMPEKDIERAVDMMRTLGMRYHLAITPINRGLFDKNPDMERLYSGEHLSLFKLKGEVPWVEAYDSPLPVICSRRAHIAQLNFPRWDALRNAGFIFDRNCEYTETESAKLLNFLTSEWNSRRRVFDRGWKNREDRIKNNLNLFLFSLRRPFDPKRALTTDLEFMIADRVFDPQLLVTNTQEGYSEAAAPILRRSPGIGKFRAVGQGFRAFVGEKELPLNQVVEVDFQLKDVAGGRAPFEWIVFKPDRKFLYRSVELFTEDPELYSGLPGDSEFKLPRRVTDECKPELEKSFHRMVLKTRCPGKPHLIKYSYYPKWKADGVEIKTGTNGFMALTPKSEVTVIEHRYGWVDWLAILTSGLTLIGLIGYAGWRSRRKSTSLQT